MKENRMEKKHKTIENNEYLPAHVCSCVLSDVLNTFFYAEYLYYYIGTRYSEFVKKCWQSKLEFNCIYSCACVWRVIF